LWTPFHEDYLAAQYFLLRQVKNQLVHDFHSQQNTRLFFFFLSLWIYLWLAETSQQPISQTTGLKVIFHCNYCNIQVVPQVKAWTSLSHMHNKALRHLGYAAGGDIASSTNKV